MNNDTKILRELAFEYAQIAQLSIQSEKIKLWKKLNMLEETRPMVTIDQLPWNELNVDNKLTCLCNDDFLKSVESYMRTTMYKWNHFPVDMVILEYIPVPKSQYNDWIGPKVDEDVSVLDETNSVVGHIYHDAIADQAAIDAITTPTIVNDKLLDKKRIDILNNIFGDIIPAKLVGHSSHLGIWDKLTTLRGANNAVIDTIDRPEFTLNLVNKFVEITMNILDQKEALNLLDTDLEYIHCTGAFTDELPHKDNPKTQDVWAMGLAQIFATVSPAMHDEFEIQPLMPLFDRFGLVYYGCCDPLDRKIDIVKKIKNVKKISVSPWASKELSAEGMNGDYVFSNKPNPAFLAKGSFDDELVRRDLQETVSICKKYNTPCELILKDVSTVRYEPERLTKWANIAMEVVQG